MRPNEKKSDQTDPYFQKHHWEADNRQREVIIKVKEQRGHMTQEGHEGPQVPGRRRNCEEVDRRKGKLRKQSRR